MTVTAETTGAMPAVRVVRDLPDPVDVVWRAVTVREELQRWFPCDVVVDGGEWRVGATISFPFPADVVDLTLTGEVLEVDEPHRLVFTWGDETLTFLLEAQGAGTRFTLIDELPGSRAARNAAGWTTCLDRLAGIDTTPPWRELFDRFTAEFEPSLGEQEGPPAEMKKQP